MKIANSVAIVTGAGGGIGSAVCQCLARHGARLALVGRDEDRLEKLRANLVSEGAQATVHSVDLRLKDQVANMVSKVEHEMGAVHILVNNAAIGLFQPIAECTQEDIEQVFATNFYGALHCMQAAIPIMRKQKLGHIVNVSSVLGHHSVFDQGIYAASKGALDRISESVAAEEKKHGIKVSLIVPDRTNTEFIKHVVGPKDRAALPGGNMRQLTPAHVAAGLVKAIEHDEPIHYSSMRGRIFSLLSVTAPFVIRHMLRPKDE